MSDELRTQQEIAPCGFSTAATVPAEQTGGLSDPPDPEQDSQTATAQDAETAAVSPETEQTPEPTDAHTETAPPPKQRKFFSLNGTVRLTYAAVFVALGVVLKQYSIPLGDVQISLFYIPVFLSAAFFGPAMGFCVGSFCDLIGTVIRGTGAPVALITIGNGLMGALMGFAFLLPIRNRSIKIVIGAAASLLLVTLGLNTFALSRVYGIDFFTYLVVPSGGILPRIAFQPLLVAANTGVTIALFYPLEKLLQRSLRRTKPAK